ncbi:MAG TPA: M14 metallopeptidase family protein [Gemmatirosa sp.]|nr:M14 metallopeptidase family protein [Gemmatirosa sp.]
MLRSLRHATLASALLLGTGVRAAAAAAQAPTARTPAPTAPTAPGAPLPSPAAALGIRVGADRTLADWTEITRYFALLATRSPRVRVDTLGPTTQRRPFVMATITSPANMRRLDEIRANQARLADPRGLSPADEARLVASQPAVVMISCNIHSTEIASSQMAMELAHRLATNDTLQRALEQVVVLLVPSMNPDGQQMVVDWYERGLGTPFEGGPMPWLYHPFVGHDNNRDWYMVTQQETRLVTDVLYRRWFPEVFYDVHQQGSEGMRMTLSPYVDPIDPNVDPLIVRAINHIGAEMSLALEERGKSGVGDGATYDLWWHGGARSTPTRHNMVGLLSEAASVRIATPITQKLEDLKGHRRGLPRYERRVNFPNPWPGGTWTLRDIIDYELIASEALVRMLAGQRAQYVGNFVRLGRKQVALGAAEAPHAYVIPAGQRDPGAVQRLVEVLRLGGVEVGRATAPFTAGSRRYERGSYVVPMAQPFRAHAKDLLEPQRFPRQERWPGGPEEPPYDVAGWTLPYQLGVQADSIATPLGAVATVAVAGMRDDAAACGEPARRGGLVALDARDARSVALLHRALAQGIGATQLAAEARATDGGTVAAGSWVLDREPPRAVLAGASGACVPTLRYVDARPSGRRLARAPRVGLYRPWTANMDEGWTRWVLEQHAVPYATVSDSGVKAGQLGNVDVLLVPDMSVRELRGGMAASLVPAPYAGGLGDEGLARIRTFVQGGGRLVLLDRASQLATALGLDVAFVTPPPRGGEEGGEPAAAGGAAARPEVRPYAPGSILRALVDTRHPLAAGMSDTTAVYFTNSTTLDVSRVPGAVVVARYPSAPDALLMSGYLSGASAIAGRGTLAVAPLGRGDVVMFGFRPQHRGQSVGTFKLLFNALLGAGAPTTSTSAR